MKDLEKLWHAQNLLTEYTKLEEKEKRESNFDSLKEEKNALETRMKAYKEKKQHHNALDKDLKAKEMDYKEISDKLADHKKELYDGENNNPKELQNIEQQIDSTKQELDNNEERVLKLTEEQEILSDNLTKKKKELQEGRTSYEKQVKQYLKRKAKTKRKLVGLMKEYQRLIDEVDPDLVKRYERKKRSLGNTAVAIVQEQTCSGCRVDISPVVLKEIRHQELAYCENCGRLLFFKD